MHSQEEFHIQSRIKRTNSFLFNVWTIARICDIPETETSLKLVYSNEIKIEKI